MKIKKDFTLSNISSFKKISKFILISLALISGTIQLKAQLYGDFPYYESFTSGSKPVDITLLTPQKGENATKFTTKGMVLTPATTYQFGAVYINNKRFSSLNGIKIEFEYGMYGGTEADGISVFLFDASAGTPTVGAKGAGIGYGYNRTNNSSRNLEYRESGLSGGYLGIGIDSYGNYKRQVFQGDQRSNGINNSALAQGNHVTLRGKQGELNQTNGLGIGYNGYPVLITQCTQNVAIGSAILNPETGDYITGTGLARNFKLRTTNFTTSPTNDDYRKAFVELVPNASGGFNVTVKIQWSCKLN